MKIRSAVLCALFGLLTASCFSSHPIADSGSSATGPLGSFTIDSRVFEKQELAPTECMAGDRQLFLGFDLSSGTSPVVVRLAVDPIDGPAVRVFSSDAPFDKAVVFRRADCSAFHFSLGETGWRINHVADYRVSLELDCTRSGEQLRGSASSTHCH